MGGGMGMGGNSQVNTKLLNYLEKHQGNAKYLFATSDSTTAAPYIIKTGKAVMAMGGFNGTDPAITLKEFKQLVKSGQVKYYYSSGRSGNSAIVNWIKKHATKVKTSLYQNSSSQSATRSAASAKKTTGSRQPTGQKMPAFGNKAPNQKMPAKGKNAKGAKKPTAKGTKQVTKQSTSRKNNSQLPSGMGGMGTTGVLYDLSTIYQ
jgi:hypothetical protein